MKSILKGFGIFMMGMGLFLGWGLFMGFSSDPDDYVVVAVMAFVFFLPGALLYSKGASGKPSKKNLKTFDPSQPLPMLIVPGLILKPGEVCHAAEKVQVAKPKQVTVGYTGRSAGVSVRVMPGVTVHSGGNRGRPIRGTVLEKYDGTFYVTNQRIVLTAAKYGFSKPLSSLSSYELFKDGIQLQFGSTSYLALTWNATYVLQVILAASASLFSPSSSEDITNTVNDGGANV